MPYILTHGLKKNAGTGVHKLDANFTTGW